MKRLLVLLGLIAVGATVIRSRRGVEVWHVVSDSEADDHIGD
ncbi:hypothetical protein [Mycolicibacterium mengxianglii]|nr:hypothetical protein [Mycolicibacterium mengxianglii]